MPDTTIEIVQDRTTYHAGEEVKGTVKVVAKERIKARAVRIKLLGTVSTRIQYTETVTRDGQTVTETRTAHGSQVIVEKKLTLWGSEKKGLFVGNTELEAGEYMFPYSFGPLVSSDNSGGLPSSFEGSNGAITYVVKATIDRAMKLDFDVQNGIKVHGSLPTAVVDAARARQAVDKEEEKVGVLGAGGKIEAALELVHSTASSGALVIPPPSTASGNAVVAIVRINNDTHATTIDKLKFKLVRKVKYVAGARQHEDKQKVLAEKASVNVLPGWRGFEYRYTLADSVAGLRAKMMGIESIDSKILDVTYLLTAKVSHGPKLKLPLLVIPDCTGIGQPTGSAQQMAAQLKGLGELGPAACYGMMPQPVVDPMPCAPDRLGQ